ncbi:MAG: DUF502 domain-containing protein [Paracoccaceae bacterium]
MTEPQDDPHRRRRPFAGFRNSFLTGLIVVLPVGLTIWLIWSAIGWIDSWILPLVPSRFRPDQYFGFDLQGAGVIAFVIFTIIVGWIAKGLIGRSIIRYAEGLVARMPLVRSIYAGLKQIAETVFSRSEAKFDRACLIEYPHKGMWGVAFVSSAAKGEIADRLRDGEEILSVFLATGLLPPTGFLLFVPRRDVIFLDMSVEDAAKLIISAGLVYPSVPGKPAGDPAPPN